ncbi:hypothetical protein WR25_15623 isoform B [Diploscapter pachys]|uniref:B box-type domain-containing protein n=1 Tax=Diploscapter pachys TaxID=2018661 RepID=A0A2A2M021_9BILA|nr:hypothetical protein WR25_15623 isoform B [Diploscapter pachys]
MVVKCPLCFEPYREPKVLACFHSFCKNCLERQLNQEANVERIVCTLCNMETQLSVQLGLDSLLSDFGLESVLQRQMNISSGMMGTGQNGDEKTGGAVFGSPSSTSSSPPLSDSPVEQLNASNGSPVTFGGSLAAQLSVGNGASSTAPTPPRSACTGCKSGEAASAFCQDCSHYLCDHCKMAHQYMHCFEGHRVEDLPILQAQGTVSVPSSGGERVCMCLQHRREPLRFFCLSCNLAICRECTQVEHLAPAHHYELISEVYDKQLGKMDQLVAEARIKHQELLDMFKQVQLTMVDKRIQQMVEKLSQTIEFTSRLLKYASPTEVLVFKQLLDTRLQIFLTFNPDVSNALTSSCEVEFPAMNTQMARQYMTQLIGQVRGGADWAAILPSAQTGMPPTPIGRPPSRQQLGRSPPQAHSMPMPPSLFAESNLIRSKNEFGGSSQSLGPFGNDGYNQYDKWALGVEPSLGLLDAGNVNEEDKAISLFPPSRSQIKRQKMIYHCKFGEFGVIEGQFTEPSGVAVNAQGDIIVADTNNHRIQVFDKEGRFKFQFGECGKRDGQLLYPNRVAVNKMTGDFVVTERSPTHQIQVFNQYGQFLRKFGANILHHPRGVCVDSKGRIIVVECKVMRVIIFDMFGNILQKFSCSRYLEFPNGVCSNGDKNEILISDNRAHCIKVFSYEGQFVRQIGGEGVTNYPIGVGINSQGDVVVADNHNNFNLTVFAQVRKF